MLYYIVVPLHVLVSIVLILVVLLQTGKRADLAGAFGGGGSQTAFGPRGAANVFSKLTTICAVLFMITSLGLAILSSRDGGTAGSVLEQLDSEATAPVTAPETPEPSAGTVPGSEPDPDAVAPEIDPDDPLAAPEGDGGADSGSDDGP